MPGVMIGMASGDSLRHSSFVSSFMAIDKPANTYFMQAMGFSVAINWNQIARKFLEHPDGLEWLFLVEDDHLFPQDVLTKLISHNKDIISGLYLQRRPPFPPIMFDRIDSKGKIYHRFLQKGDSGLIKVKACGGGCLLIRRKVLETIPDPWWYYGSTDYKDSCNHDINFCRQAARYGFEVFVDTDLRIHHLALLPVIAQRNEDGTWVTRIDQGPDNSIIVGGAEHE